MAKKIAISRKYRNSVKKDWAKEVVFRGLSEVLCQAGYTVRREALKQGFGFKVASGSCRASLQGNVQGNAQGAEKKSSKIIFVERRLSQDDQNSFLLARIRDFQVPVPSDALQQFPEIIQKQIVAGENV